MTELENTPETEQTAPETEHKQTLAELLSEETSETTQGEAGESHQKAEPTDGEAEATPKTLQEWAEKTGTEVKDLYAVEVPISVGDETKNVSLGELKDMYTQAQDLDRREIEVEERKAKAEADLTRAQTELRAVVEALPKNAVSERALQLIRQKAEATAAFERQATLEAIPEWGDESLREAELKGMVELMQDYGLPPTYLQNNLNHRLLKFVRDSYLRKQRIDKALAKVQEVKRPSNTGKSAPAGAAKKASNTAPRTGTTPEDRLMTLLNG